jgi:hypothetical protein
MLMVAAAKRLSHMNLIAKHCFPNVATEIVHSQDGRTWTKFTTEQMAQLYTNMSKLQAPDFATCSDHMRMYAEQWTEYPVTEEALEMMDGKQAIPGPLPEPEPEVLEPEDEPYVAPEDEVTDPDEPLSRATHQAIINGVHAANEQAKVEGKPLAPATSPEAAKKPAAEAKAPSAPSKPGATKRVWDIADEKWSAEPNKFTASPKEFRKSVIDACESEGINPGTAATQFGKWKASKGL